MPLSQPNPDERGDSAEMDMLKEAIGFTNNPGKFGITHCYAYSRFQLLMNEMDQSYNLPYIHISLPL